MSKNFALLKQIMTCDTEVLDPILTDMLSESEISLIEAMEGRPFTPAQAAAVLKIPAKAACDLLEESYRRGVLNKVPTEAGFDYQSTDIYSLLDIFIMLNQELWHSYPAERVAAIDAWFFGRYKKRVDLRMAGTEDRPAEKVLPIEDMIDFVKQLPDRLYVLPCDCRTITGKIHDCHHLSEVCIGTTQAELNSYPDRGIGRFISVDEAIEIMEKADADGLVHSPTTHHICNCCMDCCYPFRYARERGSVGEWPKTFYVAEIQRDACSGCKLCAKRCPVQAISVKDKKAVVDPALCIGCGVCRVPCRKDAIRLRPLTHA